MIRRIVSKVRYVKRRSKWWIDLLEDYPFEIGLSHALVLFGLVALTNGFASAPGSVQQLPVLLSIAYCVLSVIGGLSVSLGLLARYKYDWAYGLERMGLFVSASAWGSYVVGLVLAPFTARSTLTMLALMALAFGCLLRARAVNRRARYGLIALRAARMYKGEVHG